MPPLKAEYIGADHKRQLRFRLQSCGGPYIAISPHNAATFRPPLAPMTASIRRVGDSMDTMNDLMVRPATTSDVVALSALIDASSSKADQDCSHSCIAQQRITSSYHAPTVDGACWARRPESPVWTTSRLGIRSAAVLCCRTHRGDGPSLGRVYFIAAKAFDASG